MYYKYQINLVLFVNHCVLSSENVLISCKKRRKCDITTDFLGQFFFYVQPSFCSWKLMLSSVISTQVSFPRGLFNNLKNKKLIWWINRRLHQMELPSALIRTHFKTCQGMFYPPSIIIVFCKTKTNDSTVMISACSALTYSHSWRYLGAIGKLAPGHCTQIKAPWIICQLMTLWR